MTHHKTDKEWKEILSTEQFRIMREEGTEPAHSGKFDHFFESGRYHCSACGSLLFQSNTKYDSGSGWPSFDDVIKDSVELSVDTSHGRQRIEVSCASCGGHLGHLFSDGPKTTGKRYCINSASLSFEEKKRENMTTETATFAGGCFWGVEDHFSKIPGVIDAISGYIGGTVDKPTYEMVCEGTTDHAEAVQVTFDPAVVSYEKLVDIFFSLHNPTQLNKQGPDVGTQYRSAIFYHNENQKAVAKKAVTELSTSTPNIVTQIVVATPFFRAEENHQKYYRKRGGSCGV